MSTRKLKRYYARHHSNGSGVHDREKDDLQVAWLGASMSVSRTGTFKNEPKQLSNRIVRLLNQGRKPA